MTTTESNPFDNPATQRAVINAAAPVMAEAAKNPEVQKAAMNAAMNHYGISQPSSQNQNQNTYGDNAYDDGAAYNDGQRRMPESSNAYDGNAVQKKQGPQPPAEEEKTYATACKYYCGVVAYYLPLRYLLILLGVLLVVAGFIGFIGGFKPLDLFINLYLIFFGLISIIIECPRMAWNRALQEAFLYWAYFIARLWGRAMLYFFLAIFCLSDTGGNGGKIAIGIYVIFCVILMLFVGHSSALKLKRINIYVAEGKEGKERKEKLLTKFAELDAFDVVLDTGKVGTNGIEQVAQQAGRDLSSSERDTIVRFFNSNFTDEITVDEWLKGFDIVEEGLWVCCCNSI